MATVRKKISELTPLTSASLDTTIVGVDNGTTYKIELDTLADAVTSRVNILDRDRLSSLESVTSSFETKGRSIISSSTQITSLGFVSNSVDISSLNSFTSSQSTLNTAFTNGINTRLQTSSFNEFSTSVDSRIIAATNEQSLTHLVNTSSFNQYTASISTASLVDRLNQIESISGSWITESETGSFAITGSNVFKGQQIVSGSFIVSISGNAFGVNENPTPNNIFWSYIPNDTNTTSIETGWIVNIETVGTYNVTDVEYDYPFVKITLSDALLQLPYRCNGYFSLPSSELKFGTDGVLKISGSLSVSGSITGSTNFNTIVNKPTLISGSSQLTSSYDSRYVLSGSITQTTWDNIASKPSDIVSGSSQLTSSYDLRYTLSGSVQPLPSNLVSSSAQITAFGFVSGSYLTSLSGAISSSSELTSSYDTRYVLSSSFSTISSSFNSRFNGLVTTGSNTFSGSQVFSGSMTVTSGQVIASTITNNSSSLYLQSGSNLYVQNNGIVEITGSIILNGTTYTSLTGSGTIPSGTVSGSSQLTSSYDTRYTLSGSVQPLPSGVISGSSQLTASFDTRYLNTDGDGVISGSSQLTSSFDTRYALSGSGGGTTPAGTVSGSSQLTSSYDGRYTLTSSFNSFTASAQSVTTGSNSFNGTQTITGSLIITTGSFIGSQIVANTSSLYLTSGSNMYVQNNGVVEITGSLKVSGSTRFETVGGDEGGEIEFGVPQTNTTLSTRVVTDIWQNRLRIFDGNTNGVFIDLSKAPTGVSGEITWKASGMVNAGTFVQLDNIKATVTSSGQRGLSLATVSGTFSYNIGGNFGGAGVGSGGTSLAAQTLTTTPTTSIFGWGFGAQSETSTYILADITNSRAYRITLQINGSYLNNFISIERLH